MYIRENGSITTKIYAKINACSERHTRRDINDLINRDIVVKRGATSSRRYELRPSSAIVIRYDKISDGCRMIKELPEGWEWRELG